MKKNRICSLLLCLILLLQSTPFPALADETTAPVETTAPAPQETVPYEEPPEVDFGGAPISNGCRTINGMTPLGGSDKILKSAQAAFIYEINTETIIYSYNPDTRLYPGSLAKIMTALIAIEEGDLEQVVTFSTQWNKSLPAQSIVAKLKEGEEVTLEALVYWMMLESANDAALNIAGVIGGSQEAFVEKMNQRAAEMGCTDTHFTNAHGLDDPEQYTTARDMAKIVQEAIQNEKFCEVFGAVGFKVPPTNRTDKERTIESDNHLIYQLILPKFNRKEVTGGKTSSTGGSGSSLVCTAEAHDMKLICLVMGTERVATDGIVSYYGNFEEMFDLLDFAFDGFRIKRVLYPDQALSQFPVERGECDVVGYPDVSINSVLPIDATLNNLILRFTVEGGGLYAPLTKDQKIATVQVWYRTSCVTEAQVFAMNSVRSTVNSGVTINSVASRDDSNIWQFFKTLGMVILGILALFAVYLVINNYRRIRGERRKARRRAARRRSRRYE